MAITKRVKVRSIRNNTETELLSAKEYSFVVAREAKYWQSRAKESQMARALGGIRVKHPRHDDR